MRLPAPEDMRGMTVRDRHGLMAGRVEELFVDAATGEVLYLGVAATPSSIGTSTWPSTSGPTATPR
jgi:hypothetical protein